MLLMNDTTRAQEQFLRIKKPILCMIGIEKKKNKKTKHQNNNQTSLSHVEQRERDPLDLATLAYRQ